MDPLSAISAIATSGLHAQSFRMRIVSENIANAGTTSEAPNGDPYRRKTISFAREMERGNGAGGVRVGKPSLDMSEFRMEFNPSHPSADVTGHIKIPNVNMEIELADMRDSGRAYQANVQIFRQAREMYSMMIEELKA
jgi:flagellar basal-body rod protein FlgC